MRKIELCCLLLVTAVAARAQQGSGLSPEHAEALHAQPAQHERAQAQRDAALHEHFIYNYASQTLPVIDDFSIDRSRHLTAQSGDVNVTLTQTIYYLQELHGGSTPDMAFRVDTAFFTLIDTTMTDTVITTRTALAGDSLLRNNIAIWPVTTDTVVAWPPYDITQYVGQDPDTVFQTAPALVQDSLLVYTVDADTRQYINPDNSTRPLILWEEDEAFVNGTYPKDPPTIGVASFDGLDRTGFPYEPETPNNVGIADHLTSVPIDLTAVPGDSVYLSFFYQPQGLSGDEDVQPGDSLRLEMYSPAQDAWLLQWSTPYVPLQAFKQVMLPITFPGLLQNGFRMRFSNRASLGGAVDHWHIDYVRLGKNRSYSDTVLQDVAFVYPANTLLSPYTSVPYAKFIQQPSLYMAHDVELTQKNLDIHDKFITWGYLSTEEGGATASCNGPGSNISSNAGTTFTSTHPIADGPCSYTYPTTATDADFYRNAFWTNATPDGCVYNDSTVFTQELSNYYSYDDGTAEAGYWLNASGGRIAYRFDLQGSDSLRAVRMYFDPIFTYGDIPNDPRDGSFLITVWGSDLSTPIFQNISFSQPEYRLWGPDHFVEYPLDSTIAVGGTIYVGWVQTNSVKMNLGLDKNRVNNDRMFYNVADTWQQSQIQGSWMIRPVMVSEVDPFAGIPTPASPQDDMRIYPDPAQDVFTVVLPDAPAGARMELVDAIGRTVLAAPLLNGTPVSLQGAAPGLYVVRVLDAQGRPLARRTLIVQH